MSWVRFHERWPEPSDSNEIGLVWIWNAEAGQAFTVRYATIQEWRDSKDGPPHERWAPVPRLVAPAAPAR